MATQIAHLFAKISAETGDFDRALHSSKTALDKLDSGLNSVAKVAAVGIGVGVAAVGGFTVAIGKSVMAAADMEQSLANITAVMGLTNEQTALFKGLIQDLGLDPKLQVTATEAAAAIEMLGKNGLTVEQIMGGAARATVLLANATGGDFALAADVATSAMLAFGIDADKMNAVVSNISGSLVQSKFDINDYALALAQGGGVAAAVGVDFEDFNATIAAISPLFSSGSDAGTSLKTMLQRLIPQSNDAADAMRELGLFTGMTNKEYEKAQEELQKVNGKIANLDPTSKNYAKNLAELQQKQAYLTASLQQGQNAFFNADGSMKSMTEIAGILERALAGLSDEQKNNALTTIFGTDAMRAAVGVAQTGEVGFTNLKVAIGKTDAEEQAATRMDTLKGKIEILKGVVEAISLRIGDKFIPAVKKIAEWALELVTKNEPQIDKFFGTLADRVQVAVTQFIENWPTIAKSLQEFWNVVKELLPKGQAIFEKFSEYFTSTDAKRPLEWLVRFMASGSVTFQALGDLITGTIEGFKLLGQAAQAAMRLDFAEVGNLGRKAWDAFSNAGMSGAEMDAAVEAIMKRVYGKADGGWAGGMTLVGERGPEVVDLPYPSYVHTASETRSLQNGTTITIQNLNMTGTGNSGQDLTSAVTFLNSMWGYGY